MLASLLIVFREVFEAGLVVGKPVGTASFTFTSKPSGIDSTSLVRVNMQGLTYNLSKTEELSPARRLLHVQLSAIVNDSAVNIVAKPDGAQFLMNISANGHAGTTRLDAHKSAVFLPDFDPGALQTLLTLAAASNNRDLWASHPQTDRIHRTRPARHLPRFARHTRLQTHHRPPPHRHDCRHVERPVFRP